MASQQPLTEYERRRIENMKRNDETMASLKLHSKANELSFATKRYRIETKGYKTPQEKKPKSQTPIVIRRSLRARGIPPDSHLSMRDAYRSRFSDRHLIDTIMVMSENVHPSCSIKSELDGDGGSLDLGSLILKPENIAQVMPGRIMNVKFFPSTDRTIIVTGNDCGDIAFWDVDCKEGEGDGIYHYHPHTGYVSGISIQPFSLSKVFTSCYDGIIRLMDVEKESFDMIYSSDDAIFSLSQRPHDAKSLYFGEACGGLNVWDDRAGKSSSSWILHDGRINTIDFNPKNTNLMATSSTDGTACIWDLRSMVADRPKTLKTVDHQSSVHSAYFSPSGNCLATTCVNDKVGVLSGVDFMDTSMIFHKNRTWSCLSFSFLRAIWGWDDSYLFIGNMKRGVDVISTIYKKMVTLESPHMSAIPSRFAAHPYKVGILAGVTGVGKVYTWTSR